MLHEYSLIASFDDGGWDGATWGTPQSVVFEFLRPLAVFLHRSGKRRLGNVWHVPHLKCFPLCTPLHHVAKWWKSYCSHMVRMKKEVGEGMLELGGGQCIISCLPGHAAVDFSLPLLSTPMQPPEPPLVGSILHPDTVLFHRWWHLTSNLHGSCISATYRASL